jgi:hypothetical protein
MSLLDVWWSSTLRVRHRGVASDERAAASKRRHQQSRAQPHRRRTRWIQHQLISTKQSHNLIRFGFTSYLMGHGITELSDLTGLLLMATGIQVFLGCIASHSQYARSYGSPLPPANILPGNQPQILWALERSRFVCAHSFWHSCMPLPQALKPLSPGNVVGPVKPFIDAKGPG